jgi:hypothetical protein
MGLFKILTFKHQQNTLNIVSSFDHESWSSGQQKSTPNIITQKKPLWVLINSGGNKATMITSLTICILLSSG